MDFKTYFVAFLDILGFSEMVQHDIENIEQRYAQRLFKCHQNAQAILGSPAYSIIQFSDSIIVSCPFEKNLFADFVARVARYQRTLLDEGLLCRGGVAANKHFSNGSFTFSAGLIDAYKIEKERARYPRVVVSEDLLSLIYPLGNYPKYLLKSDDNVVFIDYIGITKNYKKKTLVKTINSVVPNLICSKNPSVREKGVWLASYVDYIMGTNYTPARFGRGV